MSVFMISVLFAAETLKVACALFGMTMLTSLQAWSKLNLSGQAMQCACMKCAPPPPPEKFLNFRRSEINSGAF